MQTLDKYEYRPGRYVRPGDTIRVSQGPQYRLQDGRLVDIGNRGKMKIVEIYAETRSTTILVCRGPNGTCSITAGRIRHPIEDVRNRPYRIVRCRPKPGRA